MLKFIYIVTFAILLPFGLLGQEKIEKRDKKSKDYRCFYY